MLGNANKFDDLIILLFKKYCLTSFLIDLNVFNQMFFWEYNEGNVESKFQLIEKRSNKLIESLKWRGECRNMLLTWKTFFIFHKKETVEELLVTKKIESKNCIIFPSIYIKELQSKNYNNYIPILWELTLLMTRSPEDCLNILKFKLSEPKARILTLIKKR